MGQQQLLLIVLGVIVVGIAIAVGISLFNANSINANRDAVVSDLNNLGALGISYYKKPQSMGGGNKSFTGFLIPTNLESNANGSYVATATAKTLTIVGTGAELDAGVNVEYSALVDSLGIITITQVH